MRKHPMPEGVSRRILLHFKSTVVLSRKSTVGTSNMSEITVVAFDVGVHRVSGCGYFAGKGKIAKRQLKASSYSLLRGPQPFSPQNTQSLRWAVRWAKKSCRRKGVKMRRVMLLTLLALALPTVALANSSFQLTIGPPLTVGNFSGGSSGCLSQTTISCSTGNYLDGHSVNVGGNVWRLNLFGPTGRIVLDITSVTTSGGGNCALNTGAMPGTCNFSGTLTAFGSSVPGGTFTDSISGSVTRGPNVTGVPVPVPWVLTTLTGELGNGFGDLSVTDVQLCRSSNTTIGCGDPGQHGRLRSGHGAATLDVDIPSVPEPGTLGLLQLGLLGNGVIGLVGMARRKRKLGT